MSGRKNISEIQDGMPAIRCNTGFSLVETVVALLVLTVGLLGMAALSISVMQGNNSSRQLSTATALAQDKLEELKGQGYAYMQNHDPVGTEYPIWIDHHQYKRVVEVDDDTYYDGGNIVTMTKAVTVTVSWDSDNHSVEIQTLLSR